MAQEVCRDRSQGSHHERRDRVDPYMRYTLRPRQREPFCQSNHERCARRPYVPVDEFDGTHDHPADVPAVSLRHHDLPHREQQSYDCPRTQDQDPSRASQIWRGLRQFGVSASLARIIANLPRQTLTACLISDTACHFSCKHRLLATYVPYSLTRYPKEFAMSKTAITSPGLTPPVGPFSQAIKVDGFIYFSGQVGQDPTTGKLVAGGI